jgi:glycosyltransferase involved in cell wall biosynthesis
VFEFLKYIHSGNYYRLVNQMPQAILSFPTIQESRVGYISKESRLMDIAYGHLQSGWIPKSKCERNALQDQMISSIDDNYIFINRHFSKSQVIWVLMIRLLSFRNPLVEIYSFVKALKHNRVKIESKEYKDFEIFNNLLIQSNPLVSVIIPTLNRYEYLKDVLADLEKQDYIHFEVIVCDQSEPIDETFYQRWNLNIQLIKQEEKALWMARNRCIRQSKGDYILLFDDDSRVETNWISNHLKCLEYFQVSISAGVTHTLVGGGLGKKDTYFHLSDVFDTGNAMVKREVFKKVGLFDRQFEKQRMGDSEFGIRSLLGGFLIVANPNAQRVHLKVGTGGLRQMGSWDAIRPQNLLAPRPIPSVLYLIRKYHGVREAILYLIKNIPQSYIPYKFKGNKKAKLLIYIAFPVWFILAIVSVLKSWNLATLKLRQGSLIEFLD